MNTIIHRITNPWCPFQETIILLPKNSLIIFVDDRYIAPVTGGRRTQKETHLPTNPSVSGSPLAVRSIKDTLLIVPCGGWHSGGELINKYTTMMDKKKRKKTWKTYEKNTPYENTHLENPFNIKNLKQK